MCYERALWTTYRMFFPSGQYPEAGEFANKVMFLVANPPWDRVYRSSSTAKRIFP